MDQVLPVGVMTVAPVAGMAVDQARFADTRARQRMATVTAVEPGSQLVRLSDGSIVRVTPATTLHMGATGPTVVLTDVQPGDQLVIVLMNPPDESPSALPRQVPAAVPMDAGEIMIFRVPAR